MCPYAQQTQHRVRVYMPVKSDQITAPSDSFYLHAPRSGGRTQGGWRLISPEVQRAVALRYERGQAPGAIALWMDLPRAAVDDIIATYEHRAEMFFKISRRRG